jgi:demethoxyubiquinone hydroxylase (CLK1/Coq7/Cat5 family)
LNPLDQIITVAEAVKLSGFHVRKIQRMCKAGELTARQDYKGTWVILKSSLKAPTQ